MRSTTVSSTLLLLAGAVVAQQSESVVTEIPSSLIQTTEQIFTIQTSVPTGTTSICYEVCIQEPCYACSASPSDDPAMSLPVETLPVPSSISDGDISMTLPIESLPPAGSNPTPTPSVTGSILTHTLLPPIPQTTDPLMSIPQGETPESTGTLASSSASGSASASASRSAPAEQSTAAAPPSLKGDNTSFMLALGISGVSVLFGAAWTLLEMSGRAS
ncbi:hypothetical protein BU25DRAFT_444174 [Macroventuria anomochaeta]|uniref:Uncharacterized protein n=1 Tax=Macroventuria anomochaeta TaxID=301207 RepID=A0ACB6SGJ1_9PLEO|nr:uncharacterized protein BU25DRAFT_444174 [Macroventuria anomochaeta]KAF2633420.1 hypothetical protein BU25DRAFT_444174 [Macroventuria anomochaeta]